MKNKGKDSSLYGEKPLHKPIIDPESSDDRQFDENDSALYCADDYSIYKLLDYGVDVKDGIIFIQGDIAQGHLFDIITKSRLILSQRSDTNMLDPITIVINSDGGDLYEALGIIDYIDAQPIKYNIIARGRAMSAAALLLACGTGTRAASKHTHIMIHELSSNNSGTATDIKLAASHIDMLDDILYNLLGTRTKHPKEYWQGMARRDFFMSATKALELGIIDEII